MRMGRVCSLEVLSFPRSARRPLSPGPGRGPQAGAQPTASGGEERGSGPPGRCGERPGPLCPALHVPQHASAIVLDRQAYPPRQNGLQQSEGRRGPDVLPALGPVRGRGWRRCRSPVIRGSSPGGVAGAAVFTGSLAARCPREAACVCQVWEGAGTHSPCHGGSVLHRRARPCLVPREAGAEPGLSPRRTVSRGARGCEGEARLAPGGQAGRQGAGRSPASQGKGAWHLVWVCASQSVSVARQQERTVRGRTLCFG